ncbi:hypothetical protein NE237_030649 [Protea cynaroides]|uniref:Uncharacterized protein n=1 Tax=Protea cynaroides TaxID=273540 RepID=A0A9Q0GXL6_9MAGN|nr:hypothetical protein NE237_030649 [Protea cynaroides]
MEFSIAGKPKVPPLAAAVAPPPPPLFLSAVDITTIMENFAQTTSQQQHLLLTKLITEVRQAPAHAAAITTIPVAAAIACHTSKPIVTVQILPVENAPTMATAHPTGIPHLVPVVIVVGNTNLAPLAPNTMADLLYAM